MKPPAAALKGPHGNVTRRAQPEEVSSAPSSRPLKPLARM